MFDDDDYYDYRPLVDYTPLVRAGRYHTSPSSSIPLEKYLDKFLDSPFAQLRLLGVITGLGWSSCPYMGFREAEQIDDALEQIIEFSIADYSVRSGTPHFCNAKDLQDCIKGRLGIVLPISLICEVLKAVARRSVDVQIELLHMENDTFLIREGWGDKMWDHLTCWTATWRHTVRCREWDTKVASGLCGLTNVVGKSEFLQANIEEALAYIKGGRSQIDEKFIYVARDLETFSDATVSILTLLAMVMGVLRGIGLLKHRQMAKTVEYFLDTPILLALLGLSRDSNILQAQVFLDIAKAQGVSIKVHPLILQELNVVLNTLEIHGQSNVFDELVEPYYRRDLQANDIAHLRSSIGEFFEKNGIEIVELQDVLVGKTVEWLKSQQKQISGLADKNKNAYVWAYVNQYNKDVTSENSLKAYFVTSDEELIQTGLDQDGCLIRIDNVVMNLWLHGYCISKMTRYLVSEKIYKCFVAFDETVSRRVKAVVEYFQSSDPVTEEEASIMLEAFSESPLLLFKHADEILHQGRPPLFTSKESLVSVARNEWEKKELSQMLRDKQSELSDCERELKEWEVKCSEDNKLSRYLIIACSYYLVYFLLLLVLFGGDEYDGDWYACVRAMIWEFIKGNWPWFLSAAVLGLIVLVFAPCRDKIAHRIIKLITPPSEDEYKKKRRAKWLRRHPQHREVLSNLEVLTAECERIKSDLDTLNEKES